MLTVLRLAWVKKKVLCLLLRSKGGYSMLEITNLVTSGWEAAIRGMRNPMNSWDRMDSVFGTYWGEIDGHKCIDTDGFVLGPNDLDLACRLIKAGPEHAKFLRMIHVQMDIIAPLFWVAEHDTYKVGTTRNSCSKMHKIHIKSFEPDDFTHEGIEEVPYAKMGFLNTLSICERLRVDFNATKEKKYWRALIELLPESYNMLATWDGSLQTILSILKQRKGHKLDEWEQFRQACFNNIPYCKEFYEAM